MKKKIRLVDACFPGNPSSIAGDNVWRGPEHFEWCREECDSLATWYTNWMLKQATFASPMNIAWLLEPPSVQDWPYKWATDNWKMFNVVLTYDRDLLAKWDKNRFKFAPHGGSWIDWDLWGMYEKTKDVCMIVSDKKESEGHKLRHEIAKEFGDRIDVYGPSYQKFDRKFDVLRDYRYCVVVESVKMDYYFSEKLIDPISVGCMPIYWGCPSIGDYFDEDGIFQLNGENEYLMNELRNIMEAIEMWHPLFLEQRTKNLETAKQYRMPEDWMFEHYPELFK